MSLEKARACIEKMKTDDAFCAKVLAVTDLAERLKLINAEGFACSADEIWAESGELVDADLENVAGGSLMGGGEDYDALGYYVMMNRAKGEQGALHDQLTAMIESRKGRRSARSPKP